MPNKMFDKFFHRETFSHKIHHRAVIANVALGALVAIICILPACSINANDKGKDGEKQVDIKTLDGIADAEWFCPDEKGQWPGIP